MTGKRSSERTCVACRTQRSRQELLGLRAPAGVAVLSDAEKGRGAYVCISRVCISQLNDRSLSRAFKKPVRIESQQSGDPPAGMAAQGVRSLVVAAHELAECRVLETLGLARRLGVLQTGVDQVGSDTRGGGTSVVAVDLSERSRRRFGGGEQFLTSAEIGQAVGMGKVGVARIRGGRLARRAEYWLEVWKETKPDNGRGDRWRVNEIAASVPSGSTGVSARDAHRARGI